MVGSGPYRFVADEHVSGARVVYRRFDGYMPDPGRHAGHGRRTRSSRSSSAWNGHVIPDPATAAAAMQAGEMDWWEVVDPDLNALLAGRRNVVLDRIDRGGTYAACASTSSTRRSTTLPRAAPCSPSSAKPTSCSPSPATTARVWQRQVGYFPVASPLASDAGMAAAHLASGPGQGESRDCRRGHAGAKLVALHATDVSNQRALMSVGVDLLAEPASTVEDATSDWGTVLQRRANAKPPTKAAGTR